MRTASRARDWTSRLRCSMAKKLLAGGYASARRSTTSRAATPAPMAPPSLASWRDDLETVELLASITHWRRELDQHDHASVDEHGLAEDMELMSLPTSGLERARQEWEWHAHRDQWLARLAEQDGHRFVRESSTSRLMATPRYAPPDEGPASSSAARETIKRYVRNGELRAFRHRGRVLIPEQAIERFVEEDQADPANMPRPLFTFAPPTKHLSRCCIR